MKITKCLLGLLPVSVLILGACDGGPQAGPGAAAPSDPSVPSITVSYNIVNCGDVTDSTISLVLSDIRTAGVVPEGEAANQLIKNATGAAKFSLSFNVVPFQKMPLHTPPPGMYTPPYDVCNYNVGGTVYCSCYDIPKASELGFISLNWRANNGVTNANASLDSIDFDTATVKATFDCKNPNGGNVHAQLEKALLQKGFKDLKGKVSGILPAAVATDAAKGAQESVPLLEEHKDSDSANVEI